MYSPKNYLPTYLSIRIKRCDGKLRKLDLQLQSCFSKVIIYFQIRNFTGQVLTREITSYSRSVGQYFSNKLLSSFIYQQKRYRLTDANIDKSTAKPFLRYIFQMVWELRFPVTCTWHVSRCRRTRAASTFRRRSRASLFSNHRDFRVDRCEKICPCRDEILH